MTEPNSAAPGEGTGKPKMPLHWKIAIGFVSGLLLGMVVHYGIGADAAWVQSLTKYVTQPFATLFLTLIFMLI
ncbi:MAG TPA: dicarboxylate/amino acid:cation symporter, partial [Lysobacter sp.]